MEELTKGIQWSLANAEIAGQKSLEIINQWSFNEDIKGLKQTLRYMQKTNVA